MRRFGITGKCQYMTGPLGDASVSQGKCRYMTGPLGDASVSPGRVAT